MQGQVKHCKKNQGFEYLLRCCNASDRQVSAWKGLVDTIVTWIIWPFVLQASHLALKRFMGLLMTCFAGVLPVRAARSWAAQLGTAVKMVTIQRFIPNALHAIPNCSALTNHYLCHLFCPRGFVATMMPSSHRVNVYKRMSASRRGRLAATILDRFPMWRIAEGIAERSGGTYNFIRQPNCETSNSENHPACSGDTAILITTYSRV